MSQPDKRHQLPLRYRSVRAKEFRKLLSSFRELDRTVVEISMRMYKIPLRDRAAMLQQHRRLHDVIRERLPRLLYQPQKSG